MKKFLAIFLICVSPCFASPKFGIEYTADEIDILLASINYAYVTSNDVLTDVTGTELETLTDGSDAGVLHSHAGAALWSRAGTTLSPATVSDDVHITGHVGVGIAPSLETVRISETYDHTTSGRWALTSKVDWRPTDGFGAVTSTIHGGWFLAEWNNQLLNDDAGDYYVYGVEAKAQHGAAANTALDYAIGVRAVAESRNWKTVANAIGVLSVVENDDLMTPNGDVTNAYNFLAQGQALKTTGTMVNRYGYYYEETDVTGGGNLTNQYAIYCPALANADTDNYFIKNVSAPSDFGTGAVTIGATTNTSSTLNLGANGGGDVISLQEPSPGEEYWKIVINAAGDFILNDSGTDRITFKDGTGNIITDGAIGAGYLTIDDIELDASTIILRGASSIIDFDSDDEDTNVFYLNAGSDTFIEIDSSDDTMIFGNGFTDGTMSLSGGNITGMGNITGDDVDISAGTGTYTSNGSLSAGTGTFGDLSVDDISIDASTISMNGASSIIDFDSDDEDTNVFYLNAGSDTFITIDSSDNTMVFWGDASFGSMNNSSMVTSQINDTEGWQVNGFDDQSGSNIKLWIASSGTGVISTSSAFNLNSFDEITLKLDDDVIIAYKDIEFRYDNLKFKYGALGADGYMTFNGTDFTQVASNSHKYQFTGYSLVETDSPLTVTGLTTATGGSTTGGATNHLDISATGDIDLYGSANNVENHTGDLTIKTAGSLYLESATEVIKTGTSIGNCLSYLLGNITGDGANFVSWQVQDTTDTLQLVRSGAAVTKYEILMPVDIGDGTNKTVFSSTGDLTFAGSAGLAYGIIAGDDETITCTTINVWYQVTFDEVGDENLMTGSTTTNDIIVGQTGTYDMDIHASIHTSNAQDIEIKFCKNNCTTDLFHAHLFVTTGVAGKVLGSSVRTIDGLTVNDSLECWVRCTSAGTIDVIFDHVSILAVMVGG